MLHVSAAIQDNLPSRAFKLFAAFTKTWLSTRNRRNNGFLVDPRSIVRQPPRFEGHEIAANLVINKHTSNRSQTILASGTGDPGWSRTQPELVCYECSIMITGSGRVGGGGVVILHSRSFFTRIPHPALFHRYPESRFFFPKNTLKTTNFCRS